MQEFIKKVMNLKDTKIDFCEISTNTMNLGGDDLNGQYI